VEDFMIEDILRLGRVTRFLPYFRGIGLFQRFYRSVLPQEALSLSIENFDGDLRLENLDVRETIGVNVWHRPDFFEKNPRELFCASIVPGSTVLDVGANIGIYTLLAAKRGARVFAIEADPRNLEMLRHHVHENGFDDRVTVFPVAVSDREGEVTLFRFGGNCGHSNLFEGTDPARVPCRTIDSLDLPPIDICKMDIEGSELSALRGMEATLERSPRMSLLIEYAEIFGASTEMTDYIRARFASVYAIRQPPFRPFGPLSATKKAPPNCDLWAVRNSRRTQ
jgi:FkbM family methyltransferase